MAQKVPSPMLTNGVLMRLLNGDKVPNPVVQVLDARPCGGTNGGGVILFLNDGEYRVGNVVVTKEVLGDMDMTLTTLQLEEYHVFSQQNNKILCITKAKVVLNGREVGHVLGKSVALTIEGSVDQDDLLLRSLKTSPFGAVKQYAEKQQMNLIIKCSKDSAMLDFVSHIQFGFHGSVGLGATEEFAKEAAARAMILKLIKKDKKEELMGQALKSIHCKGDEPMRAIAPATLCPQDQAKPKKSKPKKCMRHSSIVLLKTISQDKAIKHLYNFCAKEHLPKPAFNFSPSGNYYQVDLKCSVGSFHGIDKTKKIAKSNVSLMALEAYRDEYLEPQT